MIYIPSRMGQLNRRALLRQLQRLGIASRADLAKSLGLSQPTAGKIVDELLAVQVLEEVETAEATGFDQAGNGSCKDTVLRGRPGRMLRLNQSQTRLLAIQLGLNDTTVAGLSLGVPDKDEWHHHFTTGGTEAQPAPAWGKNLRAAATAIGPGDFLGVLLSVPGVVDEVSNRILFSPNIHWTEKADLAAIVRRVWNVPVLLVQEERALALGHHLANPDCEDFLLVDFGEGVGGAIIVQGKPLANPLPISGEIGHTPVLGNQRPCGCGAVGCMETLVSLRGLLQSFAAATGGQNPSWEQLTSHISENGIAPWLAESLNAAAVAIAGALNVLGLRRAVITGSLTELPPAVLAHLSQAIQSGSMWAKFGSVECVAAPRRRTAGLVAVGIDRLIVPDSHENDFPHKTNARHKTGALKLTTKNKRTHKPIKP